MALTLILGNKNYSSWSLRPWIAMKVAGIPFEEVVIPLYEGDWKQRLAEYTPAGKVPVLIDGDVKVWESLAILEHLAEKFPQAELWPTDAAARAHARAVAAEMHAGFAPLRQNCPMNMWLPPKPRPQNEEVMANVRRIEQIWGDCLRRWSGPFLFGTFGAADAMYAPVVARFYNYGLPVGESARGYMDRVRALPAWQEWREASLKEPWVMAHNEPDWPDLRKV
jgi:glutathione S-transferase